MSTSPDPVRNRMAAANPAPADAEPPAGIMAAAVLLDVIDERSGEMAQSTKIREQRTGSPQRRPHKWAWALTGGFAVVVLSIGIAVLVAGGSEPGLPTVPPPVATTIAPVSTSAAPAPSTAPATTDPAPVTEQPFTPEGWELITPALDLGGNSAAAFERVTATDSGFVAIGGAGTGIWTSPDGFEWTQVRDPSDPVGLGVGLDIRDLAVNGGRIAAVVHNGWDAITGVASSTDAENWTFSVLSEYAGGDPDPMLPLSITAHGTDGFIVSGTAIWLSAHGEEYELVDAGAVPELDAVEVSASASDGQTVVLGTSGAELLVTPDGEAWELIPQLAGVGIDQLACSAVSLEALDHGPAGFVAVGGCGEYGTAWTSPDGFVWSQIPYDVAAFGEPAWLNSIATSQRGYAVGGNSGPEGELRVPTVWTSPDGIVWTRRVLEASVAEDAGVLGIAIHDDSLAAVGWVDNTATIWRAALAE